MWLGRCHYWLNIRPHERNQGSLLGHQIQRLKRICIGNCVLFPEKTTLKLSGNGDSRFRIFDCGGHVVGMVVDGTNHPKVNDRKREGHPRGRIALDEAEITDAAPSRTKVNSTGITFTTLIRWVLDDVEDFTGMKPQIV